MFGTRGDHHRCCRSCHKRKGRGSWRYTGDESCVSESHRRRRSCPEGRDRAEGRGQPGEAHGGGNYSSSMSAFLEQSEQGAFCVTFKLVMRIFVEVGVWLTAILHERTQKKAKKKCKTHV